MDSSKFDQLTRELGHARTRRSALKAFAAALVGGAAVAVGLDDADAAARRRLAGSACRTDEQCRSGVCGPANARGHRVCSCLSAGDCAAAPNACTEVSCSDGICGQSVVVDYQTDPENCGRCGRICPSGMCSNGTCATVGTTAKVTTKIPATTTSTTPQLPTSPPFSTTTTTTTSGPTTTTTTTPGFQSCTALNC